MKHIIFILLTGLCIGQLVTTTFDSKIFKIIDYQYKGTWKQPFKFIIILINEYGGIETCGNKVIRHLYFYPRMYSEFERLFKVFNINK